MEWEWRYGEQNTLKNIKYCTKLQGISHRNAFYPYNVALFQQTMAKVIFDTWLS